MREEASGDPVTARCALVRILLEGGRGGESPGNLWVIYPHSRPEVVSTCPDSEALHPCPEQQEEAARRGFPRAWRSWATKTSL